MTYQSTKADQDNKEKYLANGLKVIGAGKDKRWRLFEFLNCNHQQEIQTGNARDGSFKCQQCYYKKISNEATSIGVKLLDSLDNFKAERSRYLLSCGHEQVIAANAVRDRRFRCQKCQREKLEKESFNAGLKLIGAGRDAKCRLFKFLDCGHEQIIHTVSLRSGRFTCKTCHFNKLQSDASVIGLQLLHKIDGNNAMYKLSCGHEQMIKVCHANQGVFKCHSCEDTWATKQSNLYLHKIEYENTALLKFGRAMNVERRSMQYGLPVGTVLTVMATWPTKTGIEADKIETLVSKQFKRYPKSKAKLVLQYSGWTECFDVEDEKAIIDFVESQLS